MRLTAFLFSTLLTALMVSAAEPQVIKPERGRNLVGRVTVDGASRQGVVVSDGVNVVTTDENGVYQMNSSGRQHVFVSVPADCKIPLENGMPKIYEEIDFGDRKHPVQIDFRLESCAKAENFTLVALADIQPGDLVEIAMLDEQIMPGMEEFASTLSGNVYGISLGDVVWNNPALYDSYKTHIRRMGIPVFHVIGNHDHNEFVHDDTLSDKEFRDAFGPTDSSGNRERHTATQRLHGRDNSPTARLAEKGPLACRQRQINNHRGAYPHYAAQRSGEGKQCRQPV